MKIAPKLSPPTSPSGATPDTLASGSIAVPGVSQPSEQPGGTAAVDAFEGRDDARPATQATSASLSPSMEVWRSELDGARGDQYLSMSEREELAASFRKLDDGDRTQALSELFVNGASELFLACGPAVEAWRFPLSTWLEALAAADRDRYLSLSDNDMLAAAFRRLAPDEQQQALDLLFTRGEAELFLKCAPAVEGWRYPLSTWLEALAAAGQDQHLGVSENEMLATSFRKLAPSEQTQALDLLFTRGESTLFLECAPAAKGWRCTYESWQKALASAYGDQHLGLDDCKMLAVTLRGLAPFDQWQAIDAIFENGHVDAYADCVSALKDWQPDARAWLGALSKVTADHYLGLRDSEMLVDAFGRLSAEGRPRALQALRDGGHQELFEACSKLPPAPEARRRHEQRFEASIDLPPPPPEARLQAAAPAGAQAAAHADSTPGDFGLLTGTGSLGLGKSS